MGLVPAARDRVEGTTDGAAPRGEASVSRGDGPAWRRPEPGRGRLTLPGRARRVIHGRAWGVLTGTDSPEEAAMTGMLPHGRGRLWTALIGGVIMALGLAAPAAAEQRAAPVSGWPQFQGNASHT